MSHNLRPLPSRPRARIVVSLECTGKASGGLSVQERQFKGQDGFWGDIDATHQHAWDADDEEAGATPKKWY